MTYHSHPTHQTQALTALDLTPCEECNGRGIVMNLNSPSPITRCCDECGGHGGTPAVERCGSCEREIEGDYCPHCVLPARVLEKAETLALHFGIPLLTALTCLNIGRKMAA
ncbi:MAG: hypothetical protein ACSLE1_03110 [Sphingobium sp.]